MGRTLRRTPRRPSPTCSPDRRRQTIDRYFTRSRRVEAAQERSPPSAASPYLAPCHSPAVTYSSSHPPCSSQQHQKEQRPIAAASAGQEAQADRVATSYEEEAESQKLQPHALTLSSPAQSEVICTNHLTVTSHTDSACPNLHTDKEGRGTGHSVDTQQLLMHKMANTPKPQRGDRSKPGTANPTPSVHKSLSQGGCELAGNSQISYHTESDSDISCAGGASQSIQQLLSQLPTKNDFHSLLTEVKETCKTEIAAVRKDLQHIASRVEVLEGEHDATREYIGALQSTICTQNVALDDMQRHIEDLDNRGRRNNIRVRGLPEATQDEDLNATLETLFNTILGELPTHEIKFDRAHRALKPKPSTGTPRDIICCLHDHTVKEQIMSKARNLKDFEFEGAEVQLYPDLSWITLQKRRLLRPLLIALRDHDIPYRWNFPFALSARKDGRSAVLRNLSDLSRFCDILEIPVPKISDWTLADPPPPLPTVWQSGGNKRRHRTPTAPSSSQGSPHASLT